MSPEAYRYVARWVQKHELSPRLFPRDSYGTDCLSHNLNWMFYVICWAEKQI